MAKEYKDLVVGLDIGTAKVMAVVAEVLPGGELRLAGLGVAPTHGLKRGVDTPARHRAVVAAEIGTALRSFGLHGWKVAGYLVSR